MKRNHERHIQNIGKHIERFMYDNDEYVCPSLRAVQWIGDEKNESPSESDRQRVLTNVELSLLTKQGRDSLIQYLNSHKMFIHICSKEADRNPSLKENKSLSRIRKLTKRIIAIDK